VEKLIELLNVAVYKTGTFEKEIEINIEFEPFKDAKHMPLTTTCEGVLVRGL